jgi:hypothetical protein
MTVRRRTALASLGAGAGVWAGLLRPTPAQAVGTAPWPDVFFLDNYGADPTGVTLSDNAWINAYSAAVNAIVTGNGTAGALVAAGHGVYQFSPNVVTISDQRIGFLGTGKGATTLFTNGSNGTLVRAAGNPGGPSVPSAPIGGFALYGFNAGNGVYGLSYGDRPYGDLFDIDARGFEGSGSAGYLWQGIAGDQASVEGVRARGLTSRMNTYGSLWDGRNANGSMDSSSWEFHMLGNQTTVAWQNQAHCQGGHLILTGACGAFPGGGTQTLCVMGSSTSDTARLVACYLHWALEADTNPVTDMTLTGVNYAGINDCYGEINLLSSTSIWQKGSLGGQSLAKFAGPVAGSPLLVAGNPQQTIANKGTIAVKSLQMFGPVPVTTAANVTGAILEPPSSDKSERIVTVVNRSMHTIAFAAPATSNVADPGDTISAFAARTFYWDPGVSLYYASK